MKDLICFTLVWFFCVSTISVARNVDLSTVPVRDSVQLTIYNSEDLTLVREVRTVTFKKGENPLQFSWANTLIDPTSVELKFLTNGTRLDVLDTTYPRDRPQVLYWNVQSEFDGPAILEITYFTSGISWTADYTAIASKDESTTSLDGYVRITNKSGEQYENARVRLVVGTINLVEKIAQLAQIPVAEVEKLGKTRDAVLRRSASKALMSRSEAPAIMFAADNDDMKEKQIIKEGLSEYFIYTIEGTQTIEDGWSKRMRSFTGQAVPMQIQYRYRPQEYGDQLVRMYVLTNDAKSQLGSTPLPNGTVRVYRENGRDGLSYEASQVIKYIPIGDKIELNLGNDPQVIFELIKLKESRDNIWMQLHGANLYARMGDAAARIEADSAVAGWDEHQHYTQRIRNYSPRPIDVEIRRSYKGHQTFRSALGPVLHDFHTVQFGSKVEAGKQIDLQFELISHLGHNAKQNNVSLEDAALK